MTDKPLKSAKPTKSPRTPQFYFKLAGYAVGILIWVGASTIAAQLIVGLLMLSILGKETFAQPVPTAIYSALSYILAAALIIFIPPLIISKFKKTKQKPASRTELGLKNLPTWLDIGLAPVGFVVYLLLASCITALFSLFPWFNAEQAQDVGFSTYIVGFDRIIAFLTLVVVAPFFEEVIFRGWLYGKLRNKFSRSFTEITSIIFSTLLVSLLFGLIHMQWNVGVNVFAMSIVLCAMREITGTIHSGIILHMLKNGVAFYLLYILGINWLFRQSVL